MPLYKITTPSLAINSYLIVDPTSNKAVVIDASRNINPILQKIHQHNAHVIAIFETHVHADFVSGSLDLKNHLENTPAIFCSGLGGDEWIPNYADFIVENGEEIILGSIRLKAQHTPGHTPEHLSWLVFDDEKDEAVPIYALTGDFLFIGSIGRPDLLGKNKLESLTHQLYESTFKILPQWPDSLEIHPAHGAGSLCGKAIGVSSSSTMEQERASNPYLVERPEEEWIQFVLKDMPQVPSYFSLMKEVNVIGAVPLSDLPILQQYSPDKLIEGRGSEIFILDIRNKRNFAEGFLPGSINIGAEGAFLRWAPVIVPYDATIVIVAKDISPIQNAVDDLHLVGLDKIDGYCILDEKAQLRLQDKLASFPMVSPKEIEEMLQDDPKNIAILDVRSDPEWKDGHIQNAIHIQLQDLSHNLHNISKQQQIGVICDKGSRASVGSSILKKNGFNMVFNIDGGMQEWRKAQLPTTKINE